jgi:hypothetical protein
MWASGMKIWTIGKIREPIGTSSEVLVNSEIKEGGS